MTPSEQAATEVEATPRTDAVMFVGDVGYLPPSEDEYNKLALHAQTLERESARLRAALSDILLAVENTALTYEDAYDFLKRGPWNELRAALKETP